jgi:flagellar protein FliS
MYAATGHYQALSIASRIEAASRHELVSILYEELVAAIDVTRAALVRQKPEAIQLGRSRTSSILVALDASLDFERGGELARTLAQLYRAMQKELAEAVHVNQPDRLADVRGGVTDLLAAWKRIGIE